MKLKAKYKAEISPTSLECCVAPAVGPQKSKKWSQGGRATVEPRSDSDSSVSSRAAIARDRDVGRWLERSRGQLWRQAGTSREAVARGGRSPRGDAFDALQRRQSARVGEVDQLGPRPVHVQGRG